MKTVINGMRYYLLLCMAAVTLLMSANGCKQDHLTLTTSNTVNLYTYMQQNPTQFSMFTQIIDKAGYASFFNTYGAYTFFIPNNDGVTAYLKATGKASVDAIDAATAKSLISIAVIADTISTNNFSDGKLRTATNSGQYLITGTRTVNNVSTTVINKQANLVKSNIRLGNGILHVIDNVLQPATLTLAQTIEKDSRYGIFLQALKETGFYDTLNVASSAATDLTRKYFTVIAETDSVFNAAGFTSYAQLKARYSTKGNPKDHTDSLWLFVGYHIWPELSYVSDISVILSHPTLAPQEITTSQLVLPNVLLNNDTFNGKLEPGQALNRSTSDVSTTSGVLHNVQAHYTIKIRVPSAVYFDCAAQPEIIKTPGLYRSGVAVNNKFVLGTLSQVAMVGKGTNGNGVIYQSQTTTAAATANSYYYGLDWLEPNVRFRLGNDGLQTIEFTTPVIVKGTYKIWFDYKRSSNGRVVLTYFDNVALPNLLNNKDQLNFAESPAQAEARGYKSYSEAPANNASTPYFDFVGRLLGVVVIKTTGPHKVRFETTTDSGTNSGMTWDAIEFRPIDMDQLSPKLGRDGTLK